MLGIFSHECKKSGQGWVDTISAAVQSASRFATQFFSSQAYTVHRENPTETSTETSSENEEEKEPKENENDKEKLVDNCCENANSRFGQKVDSGSVWDSWNAVSQATKHAAQSLMDAQPLSTAQHAVVEAYHDWTGTAVEQS